MDFTPSINEHAIYFIATSFTPCSYATSSQSIDLSNIATFEISNPLFLSIYKNFKRAVVDAYVYNKFCRSLWVDLDIGHRWWGNHFADLNWWFPKDKLSVLKHSNDHIITWAFNYLQHYLVCWAYKDNCKKIPSSILVTNLSKIGARRSDEWQAQGMSNQSSYNIELNSSKLEFCKIQAWGSTLHKNIPFYVAMLVVPTFETCSIC